MNRLRKAFQFYLDYYRRIDLLLAILVGLILFLFVPFNYIVIFIETVNLVDIFMQFTIQLFGFSMAIIAIIVALREKPYSKINDDTYIQIINNYIIFVMELLIVFLSNPLIPWLLTKNYLISHILVLFIISIDLYLIIDLIHTINIFRLVMHNDNKPNQKQKPRKMTPPLKEEEVPSFKDV